MNNDAHHIYKRWVDAWNGDASAIEEVIAEDFIFHREGGQPDITGPAALRTHIIESRAVFSDLTFVTQLGPICEDGLVAARNHATGSYKGGLPGAKAPAGTNVLMIGTDILRVDHGKITECWHNGNDLDFMLQVQAVRFAE